MPRRPARPGPTAKLFDSEVGNPSAAFTAGGRWQRLVDPAAGGNATSGHDSWFADDPAVDDHQRAHAGLAGRAAGRAADVPLVPAVAAVRLHRWQLLRRRHGRAGQHDRRVRRVPRRGLRLGQRPGTEPRRRALRAARASGPTASAGSPAASTCRPSAGQPVRPTFTSRTQAGGLGWWLDDIVIYTCDGGTVTAPPLPPPPTSTPTPNPTTGPTGAGRHPPPRALRSVAPSARPW